jgi:hypothetical protein
MLAFRNILIASVAYAGTCLANTPLSDQASATITTFNNGDVAKVSCSSYSHCNVEGTVSGKPFRLIGGDLKIVVIPNQVELLPIGPGGDEFVVGVNLVCPESVLATSPGANCSAGVRFLKGKIVEIEKLQKTWHTAHLK